MALTGQLVKHLFSMHETPKFSPGIAYKKVLFGRFFKKIDAITFYALNII